MENVRTSSYVHAKEPHFHRIPHGESSYPTVPQAAKPPAPEVALQPVAQGMPPKLAKPTPASLPPIHQGESVTPKLRTFPKASSFRNLSSNEVRCKFREREKVKITFPTKPEAERIFDRDFVEVERYILRCARSASSKSAACVYGRRLRYCLQITLNPFPAKRSFAT